MLSIEADSSSAILRMIQMMSEQRRQRFSMASMWIRASTAAAASRTYRANASEAIAKAGYVGTVDEVAYKLAALVRNSAEHWCYIGSAEYGYIAVGVTYESGMWYCDIAVAAENTDNL